MNNSELVRRWKDPEARETPAADHPAGEIRTGEVRDGGWQTAGRRAALLAGFGGLAVTASLCAGYTMTGTSLSIV